MDEEVAESLISEFERHSGIIRPDRDFFLNILLSADVPGSSRFYEVLPGNGQLLEEFSCHHYLSLRRVLKNKNAKNYSLSKWKSIYGTIASELGIFSSDALSRKIRTNKDLMNIMAKCEHPFSLLGKLQTWHYQNARGESFSTTKPILVIPKSENISKILDWEEKNTTYRKEIGSFFLRYQKRIKPEEYFQS